MTWTKTKVLRRKNTFIITVIATIAFASLSAVDAQAQAPTGVEGLVTLRQRREELSRRAVEDMNQRRLEDKKSGSTFPSDALKNTKGGVVHALTPEEQKALKHNDRGLELFSKGKVDGAIKEYQDAISSDPKLAAAQNNLGTAYFALTRFEEALAAFRRACELDPDYGQAFFNQALVHLKLGRVKEANDMLDAAVHAYNSAGEAHFKAGRFKQAEEAFRGMLQIDPEYAPALVRLGLLFNTAGRYEEAAASLRRVADREPPNAAALEFLAEALFGLKKYEEAAVSAERALKLSREFPDALYIAGISRASLGQRDAALAHLARLQQLDSPDLAQQLSDFINKKAPAK